MHSAHGALPPPLPFFAVCACVCLCAGKNNIKEGGPHGSMAPSGRLRCQLEKGKNIQPRRTASLSLVPARVAVGGLFVCVGFGA